MPPILRKGAEWFAGIGTEKSKGTKVFALAGKITNTGLIEVPMGTPLRQIVEEMGGGAPDGGKIKAVQTGGPSGGCIPADALDTPVDYESLTKLGSIMGSGGMIVMDDTTKMVDVARFFMEFCVDESCGKCIPCRAGTVQMLHLLEKILNRQATARDLAKLEELCDMVKNTSLCGLGQTAPNPTLSTLRFFRKEYEELLQPDPFGPRGNGEAKKTELANPNNFMAAKTLTIDGKEVSAEEGATILEVATDAGIKIPTLCHLDGVYDVGACRLCLVEVAGIAKLLPACTTKISEGMDVKTDSERLRKYRRMTLELLFAERNHVCAVCVANGHCELQTLAYSQGMDHVRYDYCIPEMERGRDAPAVRHGPQPLHPLRPLRARLLAHRRRGHQERLRPRRQGQHHHRFEPAVGRFRDLHGLRQMRHVLSDRRAVSQRLDGGRNGTRPRQTGIHRQRPGEKTMAAVKFEL